MKSPRSASASLVVTGAAALVGLAASSLLLAAHADLAGGLLKRVCGGPAGGCDVVLASGWAWVPPILDAELPPDADRGRLPAAAVGTAYFAALATLVLCLGHRARAPRAHLGLYAYVLSGCVVSAGYLAVMLTRVGAVCPLCLTTHGANFVLLGALFVVRPRPEDAPLTLAREHGLAAAVAGLLAATTALAAGQWLRAGAARDAAEDRLAVLEQQGELVELAHLADRTFTADEAARARFDAILRPDDPQIAPSSGTHGTLVYFGDLECPNCHRFELFLRDELLPMFGGHLRVVFKHFPLEELHDQALPAALALEAARRQGRFWQLHALAVEEHGRLDLVDWADLAVEAGCDRARFERDLASPEVAERVALDEELGRSIGVDGTPTVFLDRREVEPSIRTLPGFWRLRADALRRARAAREEPW